jgi:tRNA pseudouridine13 synthase
MGGCSTEPGFRGQLKYRFSDFLVNEVQPSGNVVHLTCTRAVNPADAAAFAAAQAAAAGGAEKGVEGAAVGGVVEAGPRKEVDLVAAEAALAPAIGAEQAAKVCAFAAEVHAAAAAEAEAGKGASKEASKEAVKVTAVRSVLLEPETDKEKRKLVRPSTRSAAKPQLRVSVPSAPATHCPAPRLDNQSCFCFGSLQTHQLVREHLPGLGTDSVKAEGSDALSTIRVFVDSEAKKSNKKQKGKEGKGGQAFFRTGEQKSKYVAFTLYKENIDTMSVVSLLSKLVRVRPAAFGYAGTKDKRACTAQRLTVHRVDVARLVALNKTLKVSGLQVGASWLTLTGLTHLSLTFERVCLLRRARGWVTSSRRMRRSSWASYTATASRSCCAVRCLDPCVRQHRLCGLGTTRAWRV